MLELMCSDTKFTGSARNYVCTTNMLTGNNNKTCCTFNVFIVLKTKYFLFIIAFITDKAQITFLVDLFVKIIRHLNLLKIYYQLSSYLLNLTVLVKNMFE